MGHKPPKRPSKALGTAKRYVGVGLLLLPLLRGVFVLGLDLAYEWIRRRRNP